MKKQWQDLIKQDPDLALDLIEERAALIQDGIPCSRWLAEETAAKQWGAQSWGDVMRAIRRAKKAR